MAKINFPDPASVQTYEAGGITWTWNDTLKVWSTEVSASSGGGGGSTGDDSKWIENSGKLYPKTLANNVGIATNAPSVELEVKGNILAGANSNQGSITLPNHSGVDTNSIFQINTQSNLNASLSLTNCRSNSQGDPAVFFGKAANNISSPTIVGASQAFGHLVFSGYDGSAYVRGAQISTEVDGTPAAGSMPGRIVLSTTADAASSPTERVRIDSSGNVGIGESNPQETLHVNGSVRLSSLTNISSLATDSNGNLIAGSGGGGGGGTLQNLSYTAAANQGTVTITDGSDAVIPVADNTNAGLFTAAEKSKLDGLNTNAENSTAFLSKVDDDTAAGEITFAQDILVSGNVAVGNGGGDVNENTAVGENALGANTTGSLNTALGRASLSSNTTGDANTAVGNGTLTMIQTGEKNTALGNGVMFEASAGQENTGIGSNALRNHTTGTWNTAVGSDALFSNKDGNANTAIGYNAGANLQDGNPAQSISQSISIGWGSAVSGDNQLQLGRSSVTAYAYGAVQDRSDERDKRDIQDTVLGLSFINDLRPVDYRYDYRDNYLADEPDENGVRAMGVRDGSKAGERFHHGLIAQEVKAVADAHGVDFGGYQDHKVNGGCDVLSLGYTELIAPLIKAVQELSAENADLKARIEALENA